MIVTEEFIRELYNTAYEQECNDRLVMRGLTAASDSGFYKALYRTSCKIKEINEHK